MRWFGCWVVPCAVALLAGCAPEGDTESDEIPPTSTGQVVLSDGSALELEGKSLLASAASLSVLLQSSEAGAILYTLDGSDPEPGASRTSSGGQRTLFTLSEDTKVRWRAQDQAGNLEEAIHEGEVKFDRVAPAITVDPEGGTFAGRVRVRVETSEPAQVLWATGDRLPFEGSAHTQSGESPLEFELSESTRLRVRAIDPAGNTTLTEGYDFVIDAQAPLTAANPPGGRYYGPLVVALSSDDPTAAIHFTTDGSVPTLDSPVYADPLPIAGDQVLRFRGVDPGGNLEPVHLERYDFGGVGARRSQIDGEDVFPAAGGLALAGALIDAAGPLSGVSEAAGFGRDWTAWGVGRTTAEAFLLQSSIGVHALYAPAVRERALSDEAVPDGNGNGTNLDETFDAMVAEMAATAGVEAPAGLFPLYGFYEVGQSRLIRPISGRNDEHGLPDWNEDFLLMRWEGTGGRGRALTVPALTGGLEALTARADTATAGERLEFPGDFATDVAPAVGLRCGGCHAAGAVAPDLTDPRDWPDAGIVEPGVPGASVLLEMLSGAVPHFNDPATPEQVLAVRAWVSAGAMVEGPGTPRPGFEGREAFFGLLAAAQAGWAVERVVEEGMVTATTGELGALADDGVHYTAAHVSVTEAASAPGLPRRPDRLRLDDPAFATGTHARLVAALVELHRLLRGRPSIADDAARGAVERLLQAEASALAQLPLVESEAGSVVAARWHPTDGASTFFDTVAAADRVTALTLLHAHAPEIELVTAADARNPTGETLSDEAAAFFPRLKDLNGAYIAEWDLQADTGDFTTRRRLEVQLAILEALLARATLFADDAAETAASALWTHLETQWWDEDTGLWQTTLGAEEAVYDADLAARVVRTLSRGVEADLLPGGDARLARFFDEVVGTLRPSETWVTGETGTQDDADRDGIPKPQGVTLGNGVAPVFVELVTWR